MARPTIYTDKLLQKVREYIDSCNDTVYELAYRPRVESGKYLGEEEYAKKKTKLPTIEGLANYLGISRETIYAWEKDVGNDGALKYPEFSDIIEELRAKQADMLINNGLTGDYSQVIAKVLLTKHGYREGLEQTGKDGKDLIPETLSKEDQQSLLGLIGK